MMSRRRFMGALGVAAAAVGTGLGAGLLRRRRLGAATLAAEAAAISPHCRVVLHDAHGAHHQAMVEHVRVLRRRRHGDAPATEEVSLLLSAEAPAGVYVLETDAVRVAPLQYLSVDGHGGRPLIEAVITRIV